MNITPYMELVRLGREKHEEEVKYRLRAEAAQKERAHRRQATCVIERRSR